jgi:hypothetical protein
VQPAVRDTSFRLEPFDTRSKLEPALNGMPERPKDSPDLPNEPDSGSVGRETLVPNLLTRKGSAAPEFRWTTASELPMTIMIDLTKHRPHVRFGTCIPERAFLTKRAEN